MTLCFLIGSENLKGRYDPHFYQPKFELLKENMDESKFEVKTLKEISEHIKTGKTPKSGQSSYSDISEIPFIKSGNLEDNDKIDFKNISYIPKKIHESYLKSSQLKKGDLLVAIVGATIGKVSVYNYDKEANINQAIASVRLDKEKAHPKYVKAFILSKIGQNQLNMIKRPVARANINLKEIGNYKIILPPIKIQKEIVEEMDKTYAKIEKSEYIIQNVSKAIDKELLRNFNLSIPKTSEMISFTKKISKLQNNRWDVNYHQPKYAKLENEIINSEFDFEKLEKYIIDINYGASIKNEYVEKGIPFIRILNIKPNKIDLKNIKRVPYELEDKLKNYRVRENDLLISRSGTIGIVAKIPKNAEKFSFGSFMIKFSLKSEIDPDFASIWINSVIPQFLLKKNMIGAVQKNITIPTIKNIMIPVIDIDYQHEIISNVNKIMEEAESTSLKANSSKKELFDKIEKLILD